MLAINSFSNAILHDITFSLKEKENLIILGKNGAGKSTLAKILCNLISSNHVTLFSQNINGYEESKRVQLINYIPPKFEIFDEYITVYEFLELSFVKEVDTKKIDAVLEFVQIDKIKHRSCVHLSSGEKQLLLLASSIIHDAKITIFDEVTANMDIVRVKDVFDIFQSVFLQQKIIITHNLDLAYNLRYKILFLEEGRIEFFGSSEAFFTMENLNRFYNNTLKIVDNHLVVNL